MTQTFTAKLLAHITYLHLPLHIRIDTNIMMTSRTCNHLQYPRIAHTYAVHKVNF